MLTRLTLRGVLGPGSVALALIVLAGILLQLAGLLVGAAVMPSPATTARLLLALAPAALELALPVAFLVGMTVCFGRWHGEGTWIALRSSGVAGRGLLRPVLVPALLVGLAMAWTTHQLAPSGRRAAARGLADAASAVELVPGRFLELGQVVLHQPPGGGLLVSQGDAVLISASGALSSRPGGLLLELGPGEIRSLEGQPLAVSFDEATLPLPLRAADRRVELTERSGGELADLVARMRARGKDASYEHAVLLRRSTMPLVPLLLPLLALPLGLRWGGRPGHTIAVVVGYWALQRIGDAAVGSIGAHLSAALPLLGLAIAAAVLWAGWRDR